MAAGRDLYQSTPWLRSLQASHREPTTYIMAGDPGAGVEGGLACHLLDDATHDTFCRIDRALLNLTRELHVDLRSDLTHLLPNLLCGGWALMNSRALTRKGLGPAKYEQILSASIAEAIALAHESSASTMWFPFVDARDRVLRSSLIEAGFIELPAPARYLLDVRWDSFDDYVRAQDRRGRSSIRSDRRKLTAGNVLFRFSTLTPDVVPRLVDFALATAIKYESRITREAIERRLRTSASNPQLPALLLSAERDGRLIAFGVDYRWKDHLYAGMVGFDYDAQGRLPLYFGQIYAEVEYAIAHGIDVIDYSLGSGATKQSRGCREIVQRAYVKPLHEESQETLRLLAARFGELA